MLSFVFGVDVRAGIDEQPRHIQTVPVRGGDQGRPTALVASIHAGALFEETLHSPHITALGSRDQPQVGLLCSVSGFMFGDHPCFLRRTSGVRALFWRDAACNRRYLQQTTNHPQTPPRACLTHPAHHQPPCRKE
jgi:hypothetical protein